MKKQSFSVAVSDLGYQRWSSPKITDLGRVLNVSAGVIFSKFSGGRPGDHRHGRQRRRHDRGARAERRKPEETPVLSPLRVARCLVGSDWAGDAGVSPAHVQIAPSLKIFGNCL